jgi:serine/threonine protein kinase
VNEAAVCISVSHPNVVSTFHFDIKRMQAVDISSDSGGPSAPAGLQVESAPHAAADWKLFLIQEWCDSSLGQALRVGLLHHPDIPSAPRLELVLQVLCQCAQGVEYLHSKHIIHGGA